MALRTRVWGVGRMLVLAGALVVTFFVFFAAAARIAIRARDVVVPELGGQPVNGASQTLAPLGLTLRVAEDRRPDPKVPEGRIVAQEPRPGSVTRRPRAIRVWLSAGARAPVVPDLIGSSERAAIMRLQSDGLNLTRTVEIRSADHPADTVIGAMAAGARSRRPTSCCSSTAASAARPT